MSQFLTARQRDLLINLARKELDRIVDGDASYGGVAEDRKMGDDLDRAVKALKRLPVVTG